MKSRIFVLATFLVFLLALGGCTLKNQKVSNDQVNPEQSASDNVSNGDRRMPDFGQPERTADLRGIVKSIVGNEATILKIDFPGNRNASSTVDGDIGSSTNQQTDNREADSARLSLGGTIGGGGPMMGGGGPGRPMGEDENTRAQMLEELKKMSTGEEKVIIPVGIKMLKSSRSSDKREMVEASLTDITADKNITVWLNQEITDRKVAEFVLIN